MQNTLFRKKSMKFDYQFYNQINGTVMGAISIQPMQLFQQNILRSNFIISGVLNVNNFQKNMLKKLEPCFG